MEKEEKAQLEAQHRKETESLKEEVTRLTSLLEQVLRSKPEEAKSTTQPEPMLVNPLNLGANEVSQQTMYSQFSQPAYPIRMSSTIDFTIKEYQKNKMVKKDGLDKWVALEQRLRAFEGTSLHDHIKAVEMCLVPNVVIPKKFRVPEFIKYIRTQCPVTHLKAYCNKIAEVVYDEKVLIHFFQDSLSDVVLTWYIRLDNT
jgi:hypothetical protein